MRDKFWLIAVILLSFFLLSCTLLGGSMQEESFPTEIPLNVKSNVIDLPTQEENEELFIENWQDAAHYYGEYTTICGPVVDTHYASSSEGRPTFLNRGKPYPEDGRVTVIIWGDDLYKFENNPISFYLGKNVCVVGTVEEYDGNPEIKVTSPNQISVY